MGIKTNLRRGLGSCSALEPPRLRLRLNERSIIPTRALANFHVQIPHVSFPGITGYLFVPAVSINTMKHLLPLPHPHAVYQTRKLRIFRLTTTYDIKLLIPMHPLIC